MSPPRHTGSTFTSSHRPWVIALVAALFLSMVLCGHVLAADPSPMLIDPLDPRAGDGANGFGSPLIAAIAVVGLGALAALGTALYVRFARKG